MYCELATQSTLTLEIIDDVARLVELEPDWSCFAQKIPGLTPFQLPQWLFTWWKHFGNGQLHVLVFRDRDGIVGVVPCFRHHWNGLRQITLIGSGISDYLEPAISLEYQPAILDHLRNHLAADPGWDVCDWQDLSAQTPLAGIRPGADFELIASPDVPCTEIRFNGSFEKFCASRSKDLRRNLRRYRKKAEAIGAVQFEVGNEAHPELMNALIELHTAKWEKRGEPGMIQANSSAEFLCEVARGFSTRDMLRFFSLRFQGKIVALILAFPYRKTMCGYLTAFDPEHEPLGFGRTLLFEALGFSYENGYNAWNFLRGEEPYKFWWGAELIPKCRVRLTRTKA